MTLFIEKKLSLSSFLWHFLALIHLHMHVHLGYNTLFLFVFFIKIYFNYFFTKDGSLVLQVTHGCVCFKIPKLPSLTWLAKYEGDINS